METLVIGHKNPDMDSICSAIGYARLKSLQGQTGVRAARAGNTNKRIDYVLGRFGVPAPHFVSDVSPRVVDVMEKRVISMPEDTPVYQAINLIEHNQLRGLPVTDHAGRCLGLLSAFKLSQYMFPLRDEISRARIVKASIQTIISSIGGRLLAHKADDEIKEHLLMVGAMSHDELSRRIQSYDPDRVVLCVGDREDILKMAIQQRVCAIVVSGGLPVGADTTRQAREAGVVLISSSFDTASTVLLARGSVAVREMLDRDFRSFLPDTPLDVARAKAAASRWFIFPVLDEDGILVGILSKSDFLKDIPRQLILVDHNELAQAVDGAAELTIAEIIDHHRLGGYATAAPIHFWNNPVGSTSTIVALLYRQSGIAVPKDIAGLLVAGLVSDTLNLTSPTATGIDREVRDELAKIAGVDPEQLALDIFSVGSPLREMTPAEVIGLDCKDYEEVGRQFTVAQVEELGLSELEDRRENLLMAMETRVKESRTSFMALLVTDITTQNSVLLGAGDPLVLAGIDYPSVGRHAWMMDGVVSRKKQLVPYLIQVAKAARGGKG